MKKYGNDKKKIDEIISNNNDMKKIFIEMKETSLKLYKLKPKSKAHGYVWVSLRE